MSGGPPPREVVGFFKVVAKSEKAVTLVGDSGTCVFHLSAEDLEYYVIGELYLITATRPG